MMTASPWVRWQEPVLRSASRLLAGLRRLSSRKALSCLLAAAIAMCIRAAVLPLLPPPEPVIQDEFAYLLGAETFAAGRLTNPPHPMWVHFETMHENFQ